MTVMKKSSVEVAFKVNKRTKTTNKSVIDFFKKAVKTTATETTTTTKVGDVTAVATPTIPTKSSVSDDFVKTLSPEQKELLNLELTTMDPTWFEALRKEFTKDYFLNLKRFLRTQEKNQVKVFPLKEDIYSWSRLTPLTNVKAIILGQDPYHNDNQAHGLAFSVRHPTPPPPSLKNIYKALKIDYPEFEDPSKVGDLTKWAEQGVLMLNTCLTVKAHNANSHAKQGWEQFTEMILRKAVVESDNKIVLLLWGMPAQKRVEKMKIDKDRVLVLKSAHPSPLSARRGFFDANHFKKCNDWLIDQGEKPIDWALKDGNVIDYYKK